MEYVLVNKEIRVARRQRRGGEAASSRDCDALTTRTSRTHRTASASATTTATTSEERSFELRLNGARVSEQRVIVGREERVDCPVEAALQIAIRRVNSDVIHTHGRLAREDPARVLLAHLFAARLRDEAVID